MSQITQKLSSQIDLLSSKLLSTLDEQIFFQTLSLYFSQVVEKVDKIKIHQALEDCSSRLVSINGQTVTNGLHLGKGEGIAGHVIRTKKAYFSNNIERDPLFMLEAREGVKRELCVPISHEGIILATLHFQVINTDREFHRDDISNILEVLNQLSAPIRNMKIFLSAKYLNEALLKKIEKKEKEIEENRGGLQLTDSYRIMEPEIIGKSAKIKELKALADKVAETDVNCLIEGEAGAGKELIARRIHCRSSRSQRAFVAIDCSALTDELLEKELFGEETGNFSSGIKIRNGALELAHGGTLLMKRICALSPRLQSKLLGFIKESMTFRVGGPVPFKSDVRIISSTTTILSEKVEKNEFREDLFYVLNKMNFTAPALRTHNEDIELLANKFLNESKKMEDQKSFSPGVLLALQEYSWPGNVRELQNIIERAYILSDGMIIEKDHLAESVGRSDAHFEEEESISYQEMTLDELEKRHICMTLDHLAGNKTRTAKTLGITVKTLYNKLHSYGMIAAKEA